MVFKVELEDKQQAFVKALLNKVLMGTTINAPSATITDFDLDRIEFTEGGEKFALRMWNVHETENDLHVEWTLFHIVPDENGSHGNELCKGKTTVSTKAKRGGARPGSGRKVTPYKIPLNVRITQEAADMIADIPAKSEYIDELIKKAAK